MALLAKTKDTPQSLSNELVTARQAYDDTRVSVVTRATERVEAIDLTIADLEADKSVLNSVVASAQKG